VTPSFAPPGLIGGSYKSRLLPHKMIPYMWKTIPHFHSLISCQPMHLVDLFPMIILCFRTNSEIPPAELPEMTTPPFSILMPPATFPCAGAILNHFYRMASGFPQSRLVASQCKTLLALSPPFPLQPLLSLKGFMLVYSPLLVTFLIVRRTIKGVDQSFPFFFC